MARAAIYVRVSTSRQAERDLSLPDQIAQCRAYCERQGWEVAEIYHGTRRVGARRGPPRLPGDDLQGDARRIIRSNMSLFIR